MQRAHLGRYGLGQDHVAELSDRLHRSRRTHHYLRGLQLQQPHVVRLETRPPNLEGEGEITMPLFAKVLVALLLAATIAAAAYSLQPRHIVIITLAPD